MQPRQSGKSQTVAAYILWYTLFNNNKQVAILANKASAAREILSRYQLMYENTPLWMQQGIKTWNKGDVELENGSKILTAATSSSGIRGKSVNMLYIDEAAIIPNNVAEEFFTSVYPVVSSGKTTKIILTSTPYGYNHFWKFWNEAEQGTNGFYPVKVEYTEHPKRDQAWADEQKEYSARLNLTKRCSVSFSDHPTL
jgi:phage terminase large subunit-like protein